MRAEAVVCEKISKVYRSNVEKKALEDFDLVVSKGEIFGLLGPNGAGKTTLVKILTTLLRPDTGTAMLNGHDVVKEDYKVREIIGYAGQDSERSGFYRLTVRENLIFFASAFRNIPETVVQQRITDFAEAMNYSDKLDKYFITLSGGEKQIFVNMRSMIHSPEICFLDEPTKSLDPLAARKMRDYIEDFRKSNGTTFFLTTHNLREAEDLCDRIALIRNGRLRFFGTTAEFKGISATREILALSPPILPESMLSEIQLLPGVQRIDTNGSAHRIHCQNSLRLLPEIAKFVEKSGVKVFISMYEPDVDDAFATLMSRA